MRRSLVYSLIAASLTFLVSTFATSAQTPVQTPEKGTVAPAPEEFEVATIKPHPGTDPSIYWGGTPGRYDATNITVKMLVEQAFNLPSDQVTGGPAWAESQHFDLKAKIADARWQEISKLNSDDQYHAIEQMLQNLMRERFSLAISHHPKKLTVYALVQARGGAKLQVAGPSGPSRPSMQGSFLMGMTQDNASVGALATFLSSHFQRAVLDRTGLTGRYDINFYVANPEDHTPEAVDSAIFTALEDQLGLKLVSRKEVVDTIVIDQLEPPSEN